MKIRIKKLLAWVMVFMLLCSNVSGIAEAVVGPTIPVAPAVPSERATLTLPAALQVIEEEAFLGNTAIEKVIVPEGATEIRSKAFADSSLVEIELPATLGLIADNAFDNCGDITVTAPEGSYAYNWAVGKGYIEVEASTPVEYFTYSINEGEVTITKYTGEDEEVIVPSVIEGCPVTKIGDGAFEGETVTSVTLPETVTTLADFAFDYSYALADIHVNENNMAYSSFDGVLLNKEGTTVLLCPLGKAGEYTVPDGVIEIGEGAFENCTSLTKIVLPDGIETILPYAFGDCVNLASINFPASITLILDMPFGMERCADLVITMDPETYAYGWSTSYSYNYHLNGVSYTDEYGYIVKDGKAIIVDNFIEAAAITVPETLDGYPVAGIGDGAFHESYQWNGTPLESIVIPDGVTSIGSRAFIYCRELTSVTLPESVTSIGGEAFVECWNLTSVNLPESIASISGDAFIGCSKAVASVVEGSYAHTWCVENSMEFELVPADPAAKYFNYEITNDEVTINSYFGEEVAVIIPSEIEGYPVTRIAAEAFWMCDYIRSVVIPDSVIAIGEKAFADCHNMESVVLSKNITTIPASAFEYCYSLTNIRLLEGITSISEDAFNGCDNIVITVAEGSYAHIWCVESSVDYIFYREESPAEDFEYEIENGEVTITEYTGEDEEVVIPSVIEGCPVTAISAFTFFEKENLLKVTIPSCIKEIAPWFFDSCISLTDIEVDPANTAYTSVDGVLFTKDMKTLHSYPSGKKTDRYYVPAGVTTLEEFAFCDCRYLLSLVLPEGLTTIDSYAIATALYYIYVPESATSIDFMDPNPTAIYGESGSYAEQFAEEQYIPFFTGEMPDEYVVPNAEIDYHIEDGKCAIWYLESSLPVIYIPETIEGVPVTTVKYFGWSSVVKLREVHIPASVTLISGVALTDCEFLEEIVVDSANPAYTSANGILYSKDMKTLVAYPPMCGQDASAALIGVTKIGDDAFRFANITSIAIPDTVIEIGEYAFFGCEEASFTAPEGSYAYDWCVANGFIKEAATPVENFYYEIENGEVTITKYTGEDEEVIVPSVIEGCPVTAIGYRAFYNNSDITSVVIPEGVITIGDSAFCYCYGLTEVSIPGTVTTIENDAFYDCDGLEEVVIPEGVKTIGDYAFGSCSFLKQVSLSASLTSISDTAFFGCSKFVMSAPEGSYAYNWAVGKGFIDSIVETPATELNYSITDNAVTITDYLGTNPEVVLPAEIEGYPVTAIGDGAFARNSLITKVVLPDSLVTIGEEAFQMCESLTEVTIPGSVTHIDSIAFQDCWNLASVTLNEGLEIIEDGVFWRCGFDSITIPASVEYIGPYVFTSCENLTEINVAEGSETFVSVDGVVYTKDMKTLVIYPCAKVEARYVVPDSVETIGRSAFEGIDGTSAFYFPASVTLIDDAFDFENDAFFDIFAPEGSYAYNWAVEHGMLGVEAVLESSHPYEDNLDETWEYSLPNTVYALKVTFSERTHLENNYDFLTVHAASGESATFTGSELAGRTLLLVGNKFSLNLKSDDGGTSYGFCITNVEPVGYDEYDSEVFETELLEDGTLAITGYRLLNSEISIPAVFNGTAVSTITGSAFKRTGVTDVTVANGITTISDYAFAYCDNLTISLPASVTEISEDAFEESMDLVFRAPQGSYAYDWAEERGIAVEAKVTSEEDLDYVIENNEVTITGYTGEDPDVVIPSELDGYPVKHIGNDAFAFCDGIETIELPEGIISIGDSAFDSCENLVSISLPESLTSIGDLAFLMCSSLQSVKLPEGITAVGEGTFGHCYALESISLPKGIVSIDDSAFAFCRSLTRIHLPNGLSSIGVQAFLECEGLTRVYIPESVTSIGDGAFQNCDNISVTVVEDSYAHTWCVENGVNFELAVVDPSVENFEYEIEDDVVIIIGYRGMDKDVIIPSEIEGLPVTYIAEEAFIYDDWLESVVIPDSVVGIGAHAFEECYDLESVVFSKNLTFIGERAFSWCSLKEINLPEGLAEIDDEAFRDNEFTSVTIPADVNILGEGVFINCQHLESINVDASNPVYTSADGVVFTKDMTTLVAYPADKEADRYFVPTGVTHIAGQALADCPSILSVVLPDGLVSIGKNGIASEFYYVYIPESVTSIDEHWTLPIAICGVSGSYAETFAEDYDIPFYTDELPDSYVTPENYFNYSIVDGECHLHGSYHDIGSIFIPETIEGYPVTTIQGYTFDNDFLRSVHIPASVTTIEPDAFGYGQNLKQIEVDAANPVYASANGVLYTKDMETLVYFPAAGSQDPSAALNGVKHIGERAFSASSISSIAIPDSVTSIGESAFAECNNLTEITIPGTITHIPDFAFMHCKGLASVTLNEGLVHIGAETFFCCDKLTDITIPASVESIGTDVFYSCKELTAIHVAEGNQAYTSRDGVVFNKDMTVLLMYPYAKAADVYTIPDGVITIADGAFYGIPNTNAISFPASVTQVNEGAFDFDEGLFFDIIAPEGSVAYEFAMEYGILAENVVLESNHPYDEHANETWNYTHPEDAYALKVTFSKRTNIEENYDHLTLTDSEGSELPFTGYMLSGKSILVKGNSFQLHLTTDISYSTYGFRITNIEAISEENYISSLFETETLEDGTLAITGYNGTNTKLEIPASINGTAVTAIGDSAFEPLSLVELIVPEGVVSIGSCAFYNSHNLASVTLPASLTNIGEEAFSHRAPFLVTAPEGSYALEWAAKHGFLPEEAILECAHPYPNRANLTWTYTHPEKTNALAVYFSNKTFLEWDCDWLYIKDSEGETRSYTGDELSGETIILPGNSFTLNLTADGSGQEFGFRIIRIDPVSDEDLKLYNDFRTYALPDGTLEITGYNGEDTEITFPSEIMGTKVTAIANYAFNYNSSITGVVIPEGITRIGSYAFNNCSNLKTVSLPESLTTIGRAAFQWCNTLTGIAIPEGVTRIEDWTFNSCRALADVTIAGDVTYIGEHGFGYCEEMNNLVLPDTLTTIGSGAFYYCRSLTELVIPASVTSIATNAFNSCYGLTSITVPGSVAAISDGAFYDCNGLKEVVISNGTESIGSKAFRYSYSLESVTLPASITYIADDAFEGCNSSMQVIAPEGSYAYNWAEERGYIDLPAILESDHPYADNADQSWEYTHSESTYGLAITFSRDTYFEDNCDFLTVYGADGSIKSYTSSQLSGRTIALVGESFRLNLTSDSSVTGYGFKITRITGISYDEFETNYTYETRKLDDGTLEIIGYMRSDSHVTVPAEINGVAVTQIGESAFRENQDLISVTIPDSIRFINGYAFFRCYNLTEVNLPEGLTTIGDNAFYECTNLESITLPDSLTYLGYWVFTGCNKLQIFTIPKNVHTIYAGTFQSSGLMEIQVDEENTSYVAVDGVLYTSDMTTIVTYPAAKAATSYTIADGVTTISEFAFDSCYNLESIVIPHGVTTIGHRAFYFCQNLKSIVIPDSVTSIGDWSFANCHSLADVTLPTGITNIAVYTFSNCSSLESIVIPEGVETISDCAFQHCTSLKTVTLPASVSHINYDAFTNCPYLSINAPEGSYAYQWADERGYLNLPAILESDHPYADNADQSWEYTHSESTYGLAITFSRDTYFEDNCDFLTVYGADGSIKSYTSSQLSGRTIALVGESFRLNLTSDSSVTGYGFKITRITGISYDEFETNYTYETRKLDDGTLEIIGYMRSDSHITIPAEINGVAVTQIGAYAFANNQDLVSVTISEGIHTIGNEAFCNCANLASVTLPESLTIINDSAFYNCVSLEDIELPKNLYYLGYNSFNNCGKLQRIAIPEGVDYIYNSTFYNCVSLAEVTLPEGLEEIAAGVFENCSSLESIVLPDSLRIIGYSSFSGTQLQSIFIPKNVYNIVNTAFNGTPLTEIQVSEENTYYESQDGVLFNKGMSSLVCYPAGNARTTYTVPSGVSRIEDLAFNQCNNLESVVVSEGVSHIGQHAFGTCDNLASVTLPQSLETIDSSGFYNCSALASIAIPEGVTTIGEWAFAYCNNLTEVALPEGITTIGNYTFYEDESLREITVSEGVTAIGAYAFGNCFNLAKVTLPASITSIDSYAFSNCSSFSVNAPEGSYAYNWALENGFIYLPAILESDHPYADNADQSWTYTHDEDAYALAVTFSNQTEFENDWDYLYVTDAEGTQARYTGTDLAGSTIVLMGNSFTLRLTSDGSGTRYGFSIIKVEGITQEEAETTYSFTTSIREDGTLEISRYMRNTSEVTVPAEINGVAVTSIGSNAFQGCASLERITLPDSITRIGFNAFENTLLTSIFIPKNVSDIQEGAFQHTPLFEIQIDEENPYYEVQDGVLFTEDMATLICHPAKMVGAYTVPDGVTRIENYAFALSENMESVVVPEGVTEIGTQAFMLCFNMTSITLPQSLESIGISCFYNCHRLESITIPDGVSFIGDAAFQYCSALTEVNLPTGITTLPQSIFWDCDSLTEVTVPEGIASIQDYAFANCDRLMQVNLPASVSYIHYNAFENCLSLAINAPEGSYAYQWAEENNLLPEEAILESDHPYASNADETWTYTHPEEAYALRVTFSRMTNLEPGNDYLYITAANGTTLGYTGTTLARIPIILPGNNFTLRLASDSSSEFFGFRITKVESISKEEFDANYAWDTSMNADGTLMITGYNGIEANLEIPSEFNGTAVTSIGSYAFVQNSTLQSVVIPEGVTEIGNGAFNVCRNLESITLPNSLTSIGGYAFAVCESLKGISLPEGLTTIGESAFNGCNAMTEVVLPDSVTELGVGVFAASANLESVTLPSGLTVITESTFSDCIKLKSIEIPSGVTQVGNFAFVNCEGLESITLPASVESIGNSAFSSCYSLAEITIPEGVASIDSHAFAYCNNLEQVALPGSVHYIDDNAFFGSNNIAITAPEGSYAYQWADERGLIPEDMVL